MFDVEYKPSIKSIVKTSYRDEILETLRSNDADGEENVKKKKKQ